MACAELDSAGGIIGETLKPFKDGTGGGGCLEGGGTIESEFKVKECTDLLTCRRLINARLKLFQHEIAHFLGVDMQEENLLFQNGQHQGCI